MRFEYVPEDGILSLYVKKPEFALAANNFEYRVMQRDFTQTELSTFIEELAKFSQTMLNTMIPQEKIQDMLVISTMTGGYTWTSLMKLNEVSCEPQNFLNMLLNYGVTMLQKQAKNQKNFLNDMSEEDQAKLQLVTALLNYMNYPEPWKRKTTTRKKDNRDAGILNKLKLISRKISAFEKKYGFDTAQMLQYYRDDSLPDVDFAKWINLHDELKMLNGILSKKQILSQIVQTWMKAK